MRLILGGPAYRMEVDAHHASTMAMFALRAHRAHVRIVAIHYEHGTPVAWCRNSMFAKALGETDATHALWIDSDCSIPFEHHESILRAVEAARPIILVPTAQRDGACNIFESQIRRLERVQLDGKIHSCYAGGFGGVGFDLRWYRKHWPERPWFRDDWSAEIAALNPAKDGYMGEDYWHCRQVAERGGNVDYVGAALDHRHRGG